VYTSHTSHTPPPDARPVTITLGGNATVLISWAAGQVVTDPWLSSRIGPWRRLRPPAIDAARLAEVNVVLISHAHPDHLDPPSLAMIPPYVPVLCPGGYPFRKLRAPGRPNLRAIAAWDRWSAGDLVITAVPAVHTRCSLGYVLAIAGQRLYFAGDAGPRTPFSEIARRCGPLDAALLPVGGSSLAVGPFQRHLTPRTAARAALDLQPRAVIPIHWGHLPCLPSLLDRFRGTAERFSVEMRKAAPSIPVLLPPDGQALQLPSE
jgi:L-ascorbate metabolism protein UlaG (beta-lactamase superfamily)